MYYFKAKQTDGNCIAINRDKIVLINVIPTENSVSGFSDIRLIIETENDTNSFPILQNYPCEEFVPYLCECLFDEITSYADNVDILLENLKTFVNKKISELSEKKTRCPKLEKGYSLNWYDKDCLKCQWFYRDGQMLACQEREKENK